MEEDLVTFKIAKKAFSLGFKENTSHLYSKEKVLYSKHSLSKHFNIKGFIEAPTQSLLKKWLREKHKIIIVIDWEGSEGFFYKLNFDSFYDVSGNNSKSYEDCLEIALHECLHRISETVA